MSRDALAMSQGLRTPPHLAILATVFALRSPGQACEDLAKVAKRAASHLAKRGRYSRRTQEIGTNVFYWTWPIPCLERPQGFYSGQTEVAVGRIQSSAGRWRHKHRTALTDA